MAHGGLFTRKHLISYEYDSLKSYLTLISRNLLPVIVVDIRPIEYNATQTKYEGHIVQQITIIFIVIYG